MPTTTAELFTVFTRDRVHACAYVCARTCLSRHVVVVVVVSNGWLNSATDVVVIISSRRVGRHRRDNGKHSSARKIFPTNVRRIEPPRRVLRRPRDDSPRDHCTPRDGLCRHVIRFKCLVFYSSSVLAKHADKPCRYLSVAQDFYESAL